MASILNHFDALTNQGLKIIPLRENSKIPLCRNWNKKWDHDWARRKIKKLPKSNLGLLLGDIIDVEGDSEEANETILNLIKDYPHPTYRSSKSIHHLFLTPDASLRHFRWKEIEFRGHGHQSVLPPSQAAGVFYRWLKSFKFPVPKMPDELISFLNAKRKSKNSYQIKPGHMKIRCFCCEKTKHLHKKRFELELTAFQLLGQKWQCHGCRDVDLRKDCRIIRGKIKEK
jgi:hypothetical protein